MSRHIFLMRRCTCKHYFYAIMQSWRDITFSFFMMYKFFHAWDFCRIPRALFMESCTAASSHFLRPSPYKCRSPPRYLSQVPPGNRDRRRGKLCARISYRRLYFKPFGRPLVYSVHIRLTDCNYMLNILFIGMCMRVYVYENGLTDLLWSNFQCKCE